RTACWCRANGSRTWCSVSRAPVDLPRLEADVGRRNRGRDAFRPSLAQTGCYDRCIDFVSSELQTGPGTDRHVSADAGRQQEGPRAIAFPNRPIRPALHGDLDADMSCSRLAMNRSCICDSEVHGVQIRPLSNLSGGIVGMILSPRLDSRFEWLW